MGQSSQLDQLEFCGSHPAGFIEIKAGASFKQAHVSGLHAPNKACTHNLKRQARARASTQTHTHLLQAFQAPDVNRAKHTPMRCNDKGACTHLHSSMAGLREPPIRLCAAVTVWATACNQHSKHKKRVWHTCKHEACVAIACNTRARCVAKARDASTRCGACCARRAMLVTRHTLPAEGAVQHSALKLGGLETGRLNIGMGAGKCVPGAHKVQAEWILASRKANVCQGPTPS